MKIESLKTPSDQLRPIDSTIEMTLESFYYAIVKATYSGPYDLINVNIVTQTQNSVTIALRYRFTGGTSISSSTVTVVASQLIDLAVIEDKGGAIARTDKQNLTVNDYKDIFVSVCGAYAAYLDSQSKAQDAGDKIVDESEDREREHKCICTACRHPEIHDNQGDDTPQVAHSKFSFDDEILEPTMTRADKVGIIALVIGSLALIRSFGRRRYGL